MWWIYLFAFINLFKTEEGKSLDHVNKLPDIIHLAEYSIGCNGHWWRVIPIQPIQNMGYLNEQMIWLRLKRSEKKTFKNDYFKPIFL